MSELEDILGDAGVNQWVRNKFLAKLKAFSDAKNDDVDQLIREFNAELLEDFKIEARKAIDDVMERVKELTT